MCFFEVPEEERDVQEEGCEVQGEGGLSWHVGLWYRKGNKRRSKQRKKGKKEIEKEKTKVYHAYLNFPKHQPQWFS